MNSFIEEGKCLYKIVLPENASKECKFACEELIYAIEKACGDCPSVITDGNDLPELSLHIGNTSLATSSFIHPSYEQVGADGYVLKRRGKTIFICSFGREGVIYGVYGFLERVLGAEFYAYLDWDIPKTQNAKLFDDDVIVKPEFEKRARGMSWAALDPATERRFGYNVGDGLTWVEFEHSFFRLIPKEKYWKTNPEFYSKPTANQLCLTEPTLVDAMIKEVIARLTPAQFERDDVLAFSIGHEDNVSFCNCPRCKQEIKKYGKSGVTIRFINKVADAVNEFVEKNYPNKTVKIVFFGYGPTIDAPVKWNNDGSCSPLDSSVIAHKNVGVMLAPLGTNWAYSLLDAKHNSRTRASLLGWQVINTELFVWTYDGIYHDIPMAMDNWEHLKESYQIFKDCKAVYLFDENSRMQQFDMLRTYVRGKLMWDLNLDVEELVKKFIFHYYREAGEKVYEYYKYFRANTKEQEKHFNEIGKEFAMRSFVRTQPLWLTEDFWTKEFLENSLNILESGIEGLTNDGITSTRSRVEQEMISLACMYLKIYAHELSKERLKKYVDFIESAMINCGMINSAGTKGGVHGIFYRKIYEWRAMLA